MKKNIIWLVVAGIIIILAIVLFGTGSKTVNNGNTDTNEEPIAGVFSGSTRCEYPEANGVKNTVLVKEGRAKIISEAEGATAYVVYSGDEIYVWAKGQTTGFIYTTADLENSPQNVGVFSRSEFEKQLRAQDANCADSQIADSEFAVPTEVKFKAAAGLLSK